MRRVLAGLATLGGAVGALGGVVGALAVAAARMLAVVLVAVGLTVGTVTLVLDGSVAPVLSASMRPAFAEGDLLVVRPVATTSLTVGQVVVLMPEVTDAGDGTGGDGTASHAARLPVAHRIVDVEHHADGTTVRTRGDANEADDPGPLLITEPRTQAVVGSVPLLGHAVLALDATVARVTLTVVVVTALGVAAFARSRSAA